ncbi:hypothetical protein [Phenylobacterium sp.]|uniref:hypothetical protein n=1 Tax=Phenylobacterium sp. TaxID=1871053 RepID=UPI0025F802FF|nr:hypothetical protein [Phenylobacterium sp.]
MRYEVVEDQDGWIVRSEGCELARFGDQDTALQDVAARLRDGDPSMPAALSVRYRSRMA